MSISSVRKRCVELHFLAIFIQKRLDIQLLFCIYIYIFIYKFICLFIYMYIYIYDHFKWEHYENY